MRLFISWSGEQTRELANAVQEFFELAFASHVQTFLSDADIAPGERFLAVINENLGGADIGVILVTRQNMNNPWLLFEAGALAGKSERGAVVPLLVDLERAELGPPLSQFQNVLAASKASILQMCGRIRAEASEVPAENAYEVLLEAAWPPLEAALMKAQSATGVEFVAPARSDRDVLDEILLGVNALVRRDSPAASRGIAEWAVPPVGTIGDEHIRQFSDGQRLRHPDFGEGTVLATTGEGAKSVIHVRFETVGVKKLLVRIAPVELIE